MYEILEKLDGTYQAKCKYQDGIELCKHDYMTNAIFWLIDAAKAYNNDLISERDIMFFREELVGQVVVKPVARTFMEVL